jgi:mannose-6-phosphate isomerase-like protein (cupin superfamily)
LKKKVMATIALSIAMPALAAEPPRAVVWSAAELGGYARTLAPKMNEGKIATERLATYGNHFVMMAHREGDGEAELHETQTDFFVVESGAATLIVGGEVVKPRTTQPHEIRGPTIKGGERKTLAPGDIVHIPAGIPHQLLVAAGKEFTYFVIKVDAR